LAPFLRALAASPPELDDLAVSITRLLRPRVDPISVFADLDELAAACPTPTRDGVMQHLFGSGLMVGDRSSYHSRHNSCIDQVLARRTGMPITLAVVGIEVARRLGVRLAGVGMPGHFLIGDPDDPEWFADPFHGRTALSRRDCRELSMTVGGTNWSDHFLTTIPPRLVAARILNNLKFSCERHGDEVGLAMVMQARSAMPELGDNDDEARLALSVLN